MRRNCIECNSYIDWDVFNHSLENFGAPLCIDHQHWVVNSGTTSKAFHLYLALRLRGVPAELEKYGDYKTIDIAIPEAKVNIEVVGNATRYCIA